MAENTHVGDAAAGGPRAEFVYTFSFEDWTAAAHREFYATQDRLLLTLLRDPGIRMLAVNAPRSVPVRLAARAVGRQERPFPSDAHNRLITPGRIRRRDADRPSAAERSYRSYDRQLRRASDRMGLQAPVVITTSPLVAGFAPLRWAASVTYYAVDDWAAHHARRQWWPLFDEAYRRIAASGRSVCAVSSGILDRIQPSGRSLVVPNGLAPEEWQGGRSTPAWLAALPRPWILYLGSLDRRIDTVALRSVADRYPHGSIVLVGQLLEAEHLESLRGLPNVHLIRPAPRAEVLAAAQSSDCGIVPHVRSQLTDCMSPLKLYEYLAAGLPVAATDILPMRNVSSAVTLVPSGADFADGVAAALARGRRPAAERRDFLAANAWASRHRDILAFARGR